MKTSDLIGPTLDWAVATALGWTDYPNDSIEHGDTWHCDPEKTPFGRVVLKNHFNPSTDWSQGGPIIERERMLIEPHSCTEWCATYKCPDTVYDGPHPLIAAMRCYVASKLGDEVDIPKELL